MSQQLQSSSSSAESRQEEAAAASVAKRENNWGDAEIRLLIDLWGDDQVQSDLESSDLESLGRLTGECFRQKQRKFTSLTRLELVKPLSSPSRFLQISTSIVTDSPPSTLRASREIHDHHRVANWRHFCCVLCNAGQSMNSTRSMVYVTTVRGACAYLLPP